MILRSRPVRWLRWSAGIDTRGKIVAAVFTVVVSILMRNEIVILIVRAGLDGWWTRGLIYFVGFVTYVVGAHFNHWCFGKQEWR